MKILLAADSVETSNEALRQFRLRPWPAGTSVETLCIVDPTYMGEIPHLMERAEDLAHDATVRIHECGLAASALALTGDPKATMWSARARRIQTWS